MRANGATTDVRWALTIEPSAHTHAVDIHGVYEVYRQSSRLESAMHPTDMHILQFTSERSTFFTSNTSAAYCRDRTSKETTIHASILYQCKHTKKFLSAHSFGRAHADQSSHTTRSLRPNCEPCDLLKAPSDDGAMSSTSVTSSCPHATE